MRTGEGGRSGGVGVLATPEGPVIGPAVDQFMLQIDGLYTHLPLESQHERLGEASAFAAEGPPQRLV